MTDTKTPTQAEIETVVEPAKYDMSIHSNPDAAAWAAFFKATFPDSDEGLMHGWFANAMMAMHDHMRAERDAAVAETRVKVLDVALEGSIDTAKMVADDLRNKAQCAEIEANARTLENNNTAIRAALSTDTPALERVQHIKRGTTYQIIARGKLQTDKPLEDYAELVAYRCEETGDVWFRPKSEFTPDRFATLSADTKGK